MSTQEKKMEILEAARACFARFGYEKTTLDDIGRQVGLNKASLYYYYKNKESIYAEVIYSEANEFLSGILTQVDKVHGFKEKILLYLEERLKYIRNAINLNQLTIDSVQRLAPFVQEIYSRFVEKEVMYLSAILEASIKYEGIADCEAQRVARSIITVTEAIKNRLENCADCSMVPESKHLETVNEVIFTVSLMLDGLKVKQS